MKQVAEGVGIPSSTYRDWEYGKAIQGEPYIRLAQVFEVSLHELLSGKPTTAASAVDTLKKAEKAILEAMEIVGAL